MVIGLHEWSPKHWNVVITRMITDRIGRQEVMLPINHNYNKNRGKNVKRLIVLVNKNITVEFVFDRDAWAKEPIQVKLSYYSARKWCVLSNNRYKGPLNVLLVLKSGLLITNQIREFCYSYDYMINICNFLCVHVYMYIIFINFILNYVAANAIGIINKILK